jgi:hypothetical protein
VLNEWWIWVWDLDLDLDLGSSHAWSMQVGSSQHMREGARRAGMQSDACEMWSSTRLDAKRGDAYISAAWVPL